MEVSGLFHVPDTLPPGREPPVLIGWQAAEASEQVWTLCNRKKVSCLCQEPNPDQPPSIPSLYGMSYSSNDDDNKEHNLAH
jgi:hypothetical protein